MEASVRQAACSAETLNSGTSVTNMTSTTHMPVLDKVLIDPGSSSSSSNADTSRPASQSPRRIFGLQPADTATAASSSLFMQNITFTNRPVKRSSIDVSASSPKRQAEARAISRTDANGPSGLLIMRSPPPPSRNPFKPSKRALGGPLATEGDPPCKRVNNTAGKVHGTESHRLITESTATAFENTVPTKARRSGSLPRGLTLSTAFATERLGTDCLDSNLFIPPSLAKYADKHAARDTPKPNFSTSVHGPAKPLKDAGAAFNLSVSPSKFGLSLPSGPAWSKPSPPPDSDIYASSRGVLPTKPLQPACLAPSPIAADEHVPRPPSDPVQILPSQITRSGSSNSLNASPGRVQATFGNPFLRTQQGRARISSVIPSPSDVPPASVAPSRATESASVPLTSVSKLLSPISRNDLMRQIIERSPEVCSMQRSGSLPDCQEVKHIRQPNTADLTLGESPLKATHNVAGFANVVQSILPSQCPTLALNGRSTSPTGPPASSTRKRPLSPSSDSAHMKSKPKLILSSHAESASQRRAEASRRQSSRQALRNSLVKCKGSLPSKETASGNSKPTNSTKTRQISGNVRDTLHHRAASAGGTAPITRPPSHRSSSAPTITSQQSITDESDVFKAPAAAAQAVPRKCSSADTSVNPDDSAGMLDGDTSVMSTSALSSLANLQSLLSRMSRPSISRRTSSAFTSLNSLPETIEADSTPQSNLASNKLSNGSSTTNYRLTAGLPRYAAATSASTARQSKSSMEPEVAGFLTNSASSSVADQARRRVSHGVPEVRRGSLLPVAVNAAQRLTVRPDSIDVKCAENASVLKAAKSEKSTILKGVVAFVDVKTAEGDEAGGVFVDILRSLGARVLARPSDSITHIVFKGGRQTTVQRYRAYTKEPKPFFVGVGWIVRCRETNERADEAPFLVNPDTVDHGVLLGKGSVQIKFVQPLSVSSGNVSKNPQAKRRKTLEPKVLFPDSKKPIGAAARGQQTLHSFSVFRGEGALPTSSSSLGQAERARQRSLKFAPKIGSPLKQKIYNAIEHEEDSMHENP